MRNSLKGPTTHISQTNGQRKLKKETKEVNMQMGSSEMNNVLPLFKNSLSISRSVDHLHIDLTSVEIVNTHLGKF